VAGPRVDVRAGLKGLVALALLGLLASEPAWAARYALLVGVSGYPNVPGAELQGPPNDVPLVRGVLLQRGFRAQDIRVLADRVKVADGQPTRAAILGELDALAKKAQPGDFVFLSFGGHGSRQPARNLGPENPEPDGMDEIFLPIDVGKWSGAVETVQNAIVDDEFGAKIAAIRNRGAFVWAVFDACHSGTITRGLPDPSVRYRDVTEAALGIPAAAIAKAQALAAKLFPPKGAAAPTAAVPMTALQTVTVGPGAGGFVAFYAAQSWERTPEAIMPPGDPAKRSFGVFSYTLAEVLAMNPTMTYRQAAEQVLHRYRAMLGTAPTPMFEGAGDSLDAPVFGTKITPQILQWKIEREEQGSSPSLSIPAGSMHRLGKGAILSLLANPADPDKAAIGFVRTTTVGLLDSSVVPVAYDGKPALRADKLPDQVYARLVNPNSGLAVRVSLPPAPKQPSTAESQAHQVLERLSKEKVEGLAASWVAAGARADIRMALADGHLWFLPPTAEIVPSGDHKTLSIALAGKSREQLAQLASDTLRSVARAVNLLRLASMAASTEVAQGVEQRLSYERAGKSTAFSASQVPALRKGDRLVLVVKNTLGSAVDLNVLLVDSRYGIQPQDPTRIEAGGELSTVLGEIDTDGTVGRESVVTIVTEAQDGFGVADLRFLRQPTLPVTRGGGGGASAGIVGLFEAAGFAPEVTRGAQAPARTLNSTAMRLFSWDTLK
jgi:hypothetical protein